MAFFLPVVVGAAGVAGGFIAGYMYQPPPLVDNTNPVVIPDLKDEIDKIKSIAPRKDLNKEVQKFNKNSLKKAKKILRRPTKEQEIMIALAARLKNYRKYTESESENKNESDDSS